MYTPFDPSIPYFKSLPGAAAAGQTLRLTVILPRHFGVSYCRLVITEDGKAPRCFSMTWGDTDGKEETWYTDFTPETPALLFYHFEYDTAWGRTQIKHNENSLKGIFCGKYPWQLTVYDSEFCTPECFKGGIIYQIFPDRFYFSGQPKANVPEDRILRSDTSALPEWKPDKHGKILNNDYFCGDFRGIKEKLDHIVSLGVTCIYLNPINEAHSNHRYDTADYMHPDPLLGSEDDFRELANECHKHGIKLILDGVFSHTGADSVYFNKFGRYGSGGAYQDKNSQFRSWYTFGKNRDEYESWWNIDILPEVNENSPSFTEFITGENGVIAHWLSLGADGYRLDVADELPDEFIDNIRRAVKRGGECYLLGEVWEDATNKISHGGRRRFLLGAQLDGVMNYPFRNAIIDFMLTSNAENFMSRIYSITDNYPPQALNVCMNHLGTHDTERILTVLSGIDCNGMSREKQSQIIIPPDVFKHAVTLYKVAVSINYTLPGIPSVYYGEEAGMTGGKDPFNRGYYPWDSENTEILDFMKAIGQFRRSREVLKNGGFYPISATLGCAAFLRYSPGMPRVFTAANMNPHEIEYRLHDDMCDMMPVFGGIKVPGGVIIPPYTCAILTDSQIIN